jgi:hypothetical protein
LNVQRNVFNSFYATKMFRYVFKLNHISKNNAPAFQKARALLVDISLSVSYSFVYSTLNFDLSIVSGAFTAAN